MKRIKLDSDISENERLTTGFVGACEAGDEKIVDIMLPWAKSTNINCSDIMGVTALMAALQSDQFEIAGKLLDQPGIDLTVRDNEGKTVLNHLLKSKSMLYFDEIFDILSSTLNVHEIMTALLQRMTKCLEDWISSKTVFMRILGYYDVNFNNGNLFNTIIQNAEADTNEVIRIVLEDKPDIELTESNLNVLVAKTVSGRTGLIGMLVDWLEVGEVCRRCREKNVGEEVINRELFQGIGNINRYGMKRSKEDTKLKIKNCLDEMDVNILYSDADGFLTPKSPRCQSQYEQSISNHPNHGFRTILMHAVERVCEDIFYLDVIEMILKIDKLNVNLMNDQGFSALDFLQVKDLNCIAKEIQDKLFRLFAPVNNRNTIPNNIPEKILKSLPTDFQVLNMFKIRQEDHKDVDFNFVKYSLIKHMIQVQRVDLVRYLLINCNLKVSKHDFLFWRDFGDIEGSFCWEARQILNTLLENIANEDELNRDNENKIKMRLNILRLTECIQDWNRCKDLFLHILDSYDVNFNCGELFNKILQFGGDNTIDIVEQMVENRPDLKLSSDNIETLVALGPTGLICRLLDKLDVEEVFRICRKSKMSKKGINEELLLYINILHKWVERNIWRSELSRQ